MPWVCASTYPRTSWYGVTPACGRPETSICDSGYAVHPVVRVSRKRRAPSMLSGTSSLVNVNQGPDFRAVHTVPLPGRSARAPPTVTKARRNSLRW